MFAPARHKRPDTMKPLTKFSLYAVAALALLLVFALYGQGDFVMTLANQVWGCF